MNDKRARAPVLGEERKKQGERDVLGEIRVYPHRAKHRFVAGIADRNVQVPAHAQRSHAERNEQQSQQSGIERDDVDLRHHLASRRGVSARDVGHRKENLLSMAAGQCHHFVGARGWSADAKAGVALLDQAPRDRMKDLVEDVVADALRSCVLDERQGVPFSHDGQMAQAEQLERNLRHRADVPGDQSWIVVGAGAIGAGNENHERVHIGLCEESGCS
ncbi:MAG TPA: hypothetical protein VLW55_18870 [Burkholderiaceae bacterium]|nr:hypothetical protein [Burkholderiaceae bacterium]